MLEQKHVTLFSVSNLNCIASFFDSYAFAALRDSFCVTLVVSEFLCFAASSFLKEAYFSPHKGLEPLAVGLKVQRSTDWASGARKEARHIVSCCPCEQSPKFLESFTSAANRDFVLITVVYSEFLCFLAFSSVKKENFGHIQETQTLENWNKISMFYRLS